jgi:aminocarboxymuconate-semialdehyde decarboxylase
MSDIRVPDGGAMPNRRALIGACGAALLGATLPAWAQVSRRRIEVGGRAARVVDIHAHCVFAQVAALLEGTALAGRAFPDAWTLGPARIAEMDARGIDVQALSVNTYWWYAADRDLARRVVELHDRQLAAWCGAHPDRFVALSSVALQYPEIAAEQLRFAVRELGHRGASIGGHIEGESPTLAKYDPFWAAAEDLDVPVFMHPNNAMNLVRDGALAGRGSLANVVGNPLETTVFLTRMIFDGVLDRFPRLKICGAHGGGYLPSYLGRTAVACAVRDDAECANAKPPGAYFRDQILVDSMVFTAEGLRHLVAETGVSQVVYGSDIPFVWPDTIDLIAGADFLTDGDKIAILGGNLIALLRLGD